MEIPDATRVIVQNGCDPPIAEIVAEYSNASGTESSTASSTKDWGTIVDDSEEMNITGQRHFPSGSSNKKYSQNSEDLGSWDPMSDDYESRAFNSYKEPGVTDFVKCFPGNAAYGPSSFVSKQGDVRLYVSNIPFDLTQDGLQNLFSQIGKVVYCKVIPRHDKDMKIAFVGFETVCEAEAAIQKFNGFDLGKGVSLRVKLAIFKDKTVLEHMEDKQDFDNADETAAASNGFQNGIEEGQSKGKSEITQHKSKSPSVAKESKRLSTGKPCSFCGRLGLKWCSVCKIPYCSRDCQKNDWTQHKLVCPPQKSPESISESTSTTPGDSLPPSPGNLEIPPVPDQEQTTSSLAPSEQTAQLPVSNQEHTTPSSSDTQSPCENDHDMVDGFDVNNAKMFAEMCGFDLSQLKVVEKSISGAMSDKSSSSSIDAGVPHGNPTERPGTPTVDEVYMDSIERGPRMLTSPVSDPASKEPISPTAVKFPSQEPTCAVGCNHFFIKHLTMETPPAGDFFELVVTQVENPNFFWAQLCTAEALGRQEELRNNLQATYCNTVYERFVPSVSEVCVVQFSFDNLWYRAKVDIINNNGTLKVTYIDFGNYEDVVLDKVRRVKEEFIKFPRQALRLSLHSISSISPSGEWSHEAVSFVKSKVLGVKCKAQVSGQHNEILFVKLFDPQDQSLDSIINNTLVVNGFAQLRDGRVTDQAKTNQHCTSLMMSAGSFQQESRTSLSLSPAVQQRPPNFDRQMSSAPADCSLGQGYQGPFESRRDVQKTSPDRISLQGRQGGRGWHSNEGPQHQDSQSVYIAGKQGPENPSHHHSRSEHNYLPSRGTWNPPRESMNQASSITGQGEGLLREKRQKGQPFAVVINAIVSPWEFYAQRTDEKLLRQLSLLMQDLNQHMLKSPPSMVSLAPGDKCAAQFSVDNLWYRGVVLERLHSGFRVRYIDFGNSESLPTSAVCPLPQQFQSLPPLSLTCSLAGVSKPRGTEWSAEAVGLFKSSVANKCLMCSIVFTHDKTGTNIVSLVDSSREGEPTAANALISAGFADPFVPKDTSKYQSGGRIVPVIGHQENHAETQFTTSPRTVQGPSGSGVRDPHGAEPCSSIKPDPSLNCRGPYRGERINIAVFEPAIQSISFPEDGKVDVVVTEIVSPVLLYIQIGSVESIQRGAKLTQAMNVHYSTIKYAPFVPLENELCVALFAETGDWCRAFIKGVSPDQTVNVHYVDFGNTEMVPINCLRPLVEQFEARSYPFSALRCSLANIKPLDSAGWSDKAINFVKSCLPLFSRYTGKLIGRRKGILFVDITTENNVSVGQALVDKGLAMRIGAGERHGGDTQTAHWSRSETQRHKVDSGTPDVQPKMQGSYQPGKGNITLPRGHPGMYQPNPLECIVFQPAIRSAALPQDSALLDVMVTEISQSGIFFVQIADRDAALRLTKLSEELNTLCNSPQMTTYQPQRQQVCAALFAETGDWCRAFVKEITQEGLIEVHYVDYGNTERIPASRVRPLSDQLTMCPFFSLPCSLANVPFPQPPGWSKQVMDLIKQKVPLFRCLKTKLVGRDPGMLYVDFIISQHPQQSLVQLLINQGFATRTSKSGQAVDGGWEHLRDEPHLQDGPRPASRQSSGSTSSSRPSNKLESCVFEPAIQLVAEHESFNATVTEVASPSSLFIQVLSHANVHSLEQLSFKMNAHYKKMTYPPFQAQPNLLCAALFSETGDWCRGFIVNITPDNCVHVHYQDYGNSEVLPLSKVRPLKKNLMELPPMALRCSLAGISPVGPGGWSDNARQALMSQVPLFSLVNVKVVKKERALLVIDAIGPDSHNQETLSQFLIRQGYARGEDQVQRPIGSPCTNPEEELGEAPSKSSSSTHISQGAKYGAAQNLPVGSFDDKQPSQSTDRLFASAIPLVAVPPDDFFEVLISEVQDPDKIFLQVLNQENALELAGLSEKLSTHCCCVDNTPYKPIVGELCCARFSADEDWYRALVEQELSDAERSVLFVDYGNRDVVPVEHIRRVLPSFTRLPFQARPCHLHGVEPAIGSWSHAANSYLKEQLINQRFMVKIIGTDQSDLAVELFEISPNRQPGASINQCMIRQRFARAQEGPDGAKLQMKFPDSEQFNVVVTDVVHPGEIWAQVVDADSGNALNSLMDNLNVYCVTAPGPTTPPHPGLECCAQFSIDNTWYRARVIDCPHPGRVLVQYVDFGNQELTSPERLRTMKNEFLELPPQAVKFSLADVRPTQQAWSLEAVNWLRQIVNRQLRVRVVERLAEHLVVQLDDGEVAGGPVNINEQFVLAGFAVQS